MEKKEFNETQEERGAKGEIIFVLSMNNIRQSNRSYQNIILKSNSREKIRKFLEGEKVERYKDSGGYWKHSYKEGSLLEWCSPFDESCGDEIKIIELYKDFPEV